jgi:hypothetical protein
VNFTIVNKEKKKSLREEFIKKFVYTETDHYKKYIATLKEYPDGMCYDGYLWDSLKADHKQIERTMEQAIEYLKHKDNVFVMWDIYSRHRVYDNSKLATNYPKDTVIEINSLELCRLIETEWSNYLIDNVNCLPEDIYIYDEKLNWYVIFTHEGYDSYTNPDLGEDDYIRICFVYELLEVV